MTERLSDPEDPPIDMEVISDLREIEAGLIEELIALFLEDSPQRVEAIRAAIASSDPKEMSLAAHALKGSCGNMGAKPMTNICMQLEILGKSGSLENAAQLLTELEVEFRRVQAILQTETGSTG